MVPVPGWTFAVADSITHAAQNEAGNVFKKDVPPPTSIIHKVII